MAVLCWALAAGERRRERGRGASRKAAGSAGADAPKAQDMGDSVDVEDLTVGDASGEGGNSRKRRSAADCPDRPERERKQEGWYEWRRHEVRWEERDGDDRVRRRPKYKGKAVRLGAGAVAKEGDG